MPVNDLLEVFLGDASFVLSQYVLEALIQNDFHLLNLDQLYISVEELIKSLVESLYWHFQVLSIHPCCWTRIQTHS